MHHTHLIALVVACTTLTAFAADPTPPSISVTGTALTEVASDQMTWRLEVKNTGPELSKIGERHADRVKQVLEVIHKEGVPDKDIQTAQIQFGKNRVYRRNEWIEEGYFASTEVSFKLTELSKYQHLWFTLTEQSGVTLSNVAFDTSKRIELRKETRRKALLAAREKAIDMAVTLGGKIGKPLSISEDYVGQNYFGGNVQATLNSNNVFNNASSPAGAADENLGSLAPGSIPISVRVAVSFALE